MNASQSTPSTAELIAQDQASRTAATFDDIRLIDAPAGSGKTETIVARIIREVLVGHGDGPVPVQRIVAATFTIAAAAELRGRVRTRLEHLRELIDPQSPGSGIEAAFVQPLYDTLIGSGGLEESQALARIDAALDHLDDAPWGTLHSVCNWIVGRSAATLPTPAAVGFLDEVTRGQLLDSAAAAIRSDARERISEVGDADELLAPVTDAHVRDLAAAVSEEHLGQGAASASAPLTLSTPVSQVMAFIDARFTDWASRVAHGLDVADAPLEPQPGRSLSATIAALLPSPGSGWPVDKRDVVGYLATILVAGSPEAAPSRTHARVLLMTHDKPKNIKALDDSPALIDAGPGPADSEVVRLTATMTKAAKWLNALKNATPWSASGGELPTASPIEAANELRVGILIDAGLTADTETISLRRTHGLLSFDDLISLALGAIPGDGPWTPAGDGLFDLLVIDELQDSDPLQHALLGAVEAAGVPVIAVGDVRQSLYRFRGARPELFEARTEQARSMDQAVRLTRTFRHPTTLATAFNDLFSTRIDGSGVGAPDAVSWQEGLAGPPTEQDDRSSATPSPLTLSVFEFGGKAEQVRLEESEAVVGELLALRQGKGSQTPWSQMAILLPTRTSLPAIRHAMARHGIPSMVVAASGLAVTAEVRGLESIMRWVTTGDRMDQAGAWTSPWFARPISDLIESRPWQDVKESDSAASEAPPPDPFRGWAHLDRRRGELASAPAGDALLEMMEILGIDSRLRHIGERDANLADHMSACVRYVLGEAMGAQDGGSSLAQHVHTMGEPAGDDVEAARKGSRTGDEREAVRINTIHGAKGLEYEHVILAGVSSRPNSDPLVLVWPALDDSPRWVGGQLKAGLAVRRSPGSEPSEIKALTDQQRQAESDRLLYVALTRAKQTATVVLGAQAPKVESAVEAEDAGAPPDPVSTWLAAPPKKAPPIHRTLHARVSALPRGSSGEVVPVAGGSIMIRRALEPSEVQPADEPPYQWGPVPELTAVPVRRTTPASGTSHPGGGAGGLAEPEAPVVTEEAPEPLGGAGGAGRDFGTAVHACVDRIARQGLAADAAARMEQARVVARSVVTGSPGSPDSDQVAIAALSVLTSPLLTSSAGRVMHEVPVWAPLEHDGSEVLGGGIIDILITGDTLQVLDIKTDAIPAEGPQVLATRYGPQLRMYADALEATGSPPVARLGLLLTSRIEPDGNASFVGVARVPHAGPTAHRSGTGPA